MMKRIAAAYFIWSAFMAGCCLAQSKTGTSIGQFTLIEPSARIAAMGNAGVALHDGIQAVYYNAAALGAMTNSQVQFTHSEWFAGIDFKFAAAALSLGGNGTLFTSVTALNSGDMDVRTVAQPLGTGERFSVSDVALSLGYGRQITRRFAAGVQVNYIGESIWNSSLNVFTLSVGTMYRLTDNGLQIGASIVNFGTHARFSGKDLEIQFDGTPDVYGDNGALPAEQSTDEFPVPILFRVGLSLPYRISAAHEILLSLDALHPSDNSESMSMGAEWWWRRSLALRGGYQALAQTDSELGVTLGAGIRTDLRDFALRFDYAWAEHARLNDIHRITIVLEF